MRYFWERRDPVADAPVKTVPAAADLKAAYERGRREERARHKSHPVFGLAVALVAVLGAGMLFLAAREGSFSNGGAVVDRQLASAAGEAQASAQHAAGAVSGPDQNAPGR